MKTGTITYIGVNSSFVGEGEVNFGAASPTTWKEILIPSTISTQTNPPPKNYSGTPSKTNSASDLEIVAVLVVVVLVISIILLRRQRATGK